MRIGSQPGDCINWWSVFAKLKLVIVPFLNQAYDL
jgi:hypothetical protein